MSALHFPRRAALAVALTLVFAGTTAQAQHHGGHGTPAATEPKPASVEPAVDHAAMGHQVPAKSGEDHGAMDHSKMDHSKMGHAEPAKAEDRHSGMGHSNMDPATMQHGASPGADQAPREPIPAVTDADRAAAFPDLHHHMQHTPELNSYVLFDRLEVGDAEHGRGEAWEATAWFGSDLNRLWLRSEGEREDGVTASANLEALYGRSISPWWDAVVGVKHDFKPGRSQDWLAVGLQGMSPYKFEVQATAYLGASGQVAANVEAEYDVLLTNRLILQPLVEVEFNGSQDRRRGVGSGLSTLEAGLRLRYEFNRHFAPYVGVVHERAFGNTADLRREEGEPDQDTRVVAGLRFWF